MTTLSTSTPPSEAAAVRPLTSTLIEVRATDGSVQVRHRADATGAAPRIRAVVLSATARRARVSLVPEGALLLSGDDVSLQVTVGSGVCLDLSEPAGTVAYNMRGGSARWHVEILLEPGSALVWHGEPFVVASGAEVIRTMRARVATGATMALRETLVLGRYGETSGGLRQSARIERPDGSPIFVDGFIAPQGRPSLGLGDNRAITTVLLIGAALDLEPTTGSLMSLDNGDTVWRSLAMEAHDTMNDGVWRAAAERAAS